MHDWIKVTLVLCAFGTLREIRPSEPFVSEFLVGEWRNITVNQLTQDVYPVGTYSYLAQLCVIFLITDFLRFKPIIILSGLSGIAVYSILLWTSSLEWLQASQFFYGMYMATEVAYYTYIYAKVDPDKYPEVSSYTRMAALIGRCLSGVSSQLLVIFNAMNYRDLNYITLTAQILATFWAIWLPPVQYSIYFHRKMCITNHTELHPYSKQNFVTEELDKKSLSLKIKEASTLIAKHSRLAYSRGHVIAWSAWYACALALYVQVQTYVQVLWKDIQDADEVGPDEQIAYNGFVEATQTLLGAGAAYTASLYGGNLTPALAAALQAVAIFLATYLRNIFVSYAGYIVTGVMYHYTITLASAKIASYLSDESCFGLIFGINTLVGTALQSLITLVLLTQMGLSTPVMYYILSGLFALLAVIWILVWVLYKCRVQNNVTLTT